MSEVERKLSAAGVYAGLGGLEGLSNCQEFWDEQPYGTRLYYKGEAYLHRSVLQAAIAILKEPPSTNEEVRLRAKFKNLGERLKDVMDECIAEGKPESEVTK